MATEARLRQRFEFTSTRLAIFLVEGLTLPIILARILLVSLFLKVKVSLPKSSSHKFFDWMEVRNSPYLELLRTFESNYKEGFV